MKTNIIGKPVDRVDARLKVTGAAKYAAEFNQNQMAYAFPVRSTIGNGSITNIDTSAAEKAGGVLAVLTHKNAPRLKQINPQEIMKAVGGGGIPGEILLPVQDNKVHYWGQYIGLVVAETYEQARTAAQLVKVDYVKSPLVIDLEKEKSKGFKPEKVFGFEDVQIHEGNAANAIKSAPVEIEQTYTTSTENHHPMEPHATIAVWEGTDKLTLYDATQGVKDSQGIAAYVLNLKPENVQVIAPYIGGGFGCKGQWMNPILAAMGAQVVKRPVKFALTRQMMQTNTGRRGATIQKIALASDQSGKLTAIRHLNDTYTSNLTEFFEPSGLPTKVLYAAPNREITHTVAHLNIGTPTTMRAPGEANFALESAMDELADKLKIDPIQLRIINHADADPLKKIAWSSEYLKECYRTGAEKFGWNRRNQTPRMNRNGKYLIGYGMATATYPAFRSSATVRIRMTADGAVKVMCATQDIGTGTYTIMAQTAADALGVPIEKITVDLGDSSLPLAPVSGGSTTTASVIPAVLATAEVLRQDLMRMAIADGKSKLNGRKIEEIEYRDTKLFVKGDASKNDSYSDLMRRNSKTMMEACTTAMPASGVGLSGNSAPCQTAPFALEENSDATKYSFHSFGAQFAEVMVDEDLGIVRVSRFTSVQDVGRIMNEKTARSQVIGGVIYGLGAALMEATEYDKRWANPVTRTLADYHVPVNLDVPPIDVYFIGKPDPHISPIGARGLGEIGTTGVAAAIANAVFNATGQRIRDLPLTPDKLL
ncbi:MAG: xanthine dehydrogenase family protein molybdopterin-binding subunit [Pyrinomonadaceae bacterium]|nr:xanthine dehydrogenase family protein molybdopterin-binding subunit [Pyrinomonadaceae bacterium]